MKIIEILNEVWIAAVKTPFGAYSEIFKNPSRKEWLKVGIRPRVIIDSNKKDLYIFSNNLLHVWAAKEIGLNIKPLDPEYLEGQVEIKGERLDIIEINFFESFSPRDISNKNEKDFISNFTKKDWSWIESKFNIKYKKYFKNKIESFVKKVKDKER